MPLYQYRCRRCDEEIERLFDWSERPKSIKCDCGGEAYFEYAPHAATVWNWSWWDHEGIKGQRQEISARGDTYDPRVIKD